MKNIKLDVNQIIFKNRGVQTTIKSLSETEFGFHVLVVYPNLEILREIYLHYFKLNMANNNEGIAYFTYYENEDSVKDFLNSSNITMNDSKNNTKYNNILYLRNRRTIITDRNLGDGPTNIQNKEKKRTNKGEENELRIPFFSDDYQNLLIFDSKKYEIKSKLNITNGDSFKKVIESTAKSLLNEKKSKERNRNNNFKKNNSKKQKEGEKVVGDLSGVSIFVDMGLGYQDGFEKGIEYEKSILPCSSYQLSHNKNINTKVKYFCLYNQRDFENLNKVQKKEILDLHNKNIIFVDK